ncbi:hypothetical protein CDL12_25884 [Handroanthus impetiginosus]|uniref:Uncharacterized protein n=1 Tax=Handroanthus impetiginosus TaxID=429701 RepID=A0A2G9G8I3_9LAMI|nr:hypothetical protein CDL12_25884 [Handroanthus impetiginosus]
MNLDKHPLNAFLHMLLFLSSNKHEQVTLNQAVGMLELALTLANGLQPPVRLDSQKERKRKSRFSQGKKGKLFFLVYLFFFLFYFLN